MEWTLAACSVLLCMFVKSFVECTVFIPRFKVEPLSGSSSLITVLGSNVTLAWFCHVPSNHTLDKVYWWLVLHSMASSSPLLSLKHLDAGKITIPPHYRGRVEWTGSVSQGKLSFLIHDVRGSDALVYRVSLKVAVPENGAVTMVHRKSYLKVNVAEQAMYKGLTNKTITRQFAHIGESANFIWKFQTSGSSLKRMKAVRAYLTIWESEHQSFVELFVERKEDKTHVQPFRSDEKLKYEKRIAWTGNFTDLLFSFVMTNISFQDHRRFYLLVCFKEEFYKAIFVFTSSFLEVQAATHSPYRSEMSRKQYTNTDLRGLTSIPPTKSRNKESTRVPSLKVTSKHSDKGDPTHSTKTDQVALISAVTSSVVIIIIVIIITVCYCKVWKLREHPERFLRERQNNVVVAFTSANEEDTEAGDNKSTDSISLHETETVPALAPRAPRSHSWEFPKDKLQVREIFGQGAFGQVAKGFAFEIAGKVGWTVVAVKMLKDDAWESDGQDLLSELSIMKNLPRHRHVVQLLGCVTTSAYPLVIVEFASHGDLLGFLLKSRGLPDTYYQTTGKLTRVTAKKMLMFAWQIASGMKFLSENKVVHRDLAARNVLVAAGNVCKITDFGMARDVRESDIYTMRAGGRVPAKWTAYEALLYGVYTTQSDVWSYGVVLYEIFTLGADPYAGIKSRDISDLLGKGFRMRRPKHVDKELHAVMLSCWKEDPQNRPTFKSLQETLEKIEKQQTGYMNLQSFTDASYVNVDNARETEDKGIL